MVCAINFLDYGLASIVIRARVFLFYLDDILLAGLMCLNLVRFGQMVLATIILCPEFGILFLFR